MAHYLSVDGGGSKLNMILFDEDINILGRGTAGGVNTNQLPLEQVKRNVHDCLDMVFAAGTPDVLKEVHVVFVGPVDVLKEDLFARTKVENFISHGEYQAGLLAGNLTIDGILTLSGTGMGAAYIALDGERIGLGGWGPIVGDQGSGAWIGHQALREMVKTLNGWGEDTLLVDMIREAWNLKTDWDIIGIVHGSGMPYSKIATLTRVVSKAAHQGDAVALRLVKEAGYWCAVQTDTLLRRLAEQNKLPAKIEITLCGGAWKCHPLMFDTFVAYLQERHPGLTVHRPYFEHVCAGPVKVLLDRGTPREQAMEIMNRQLPDYRVEPLQ